MGSAGRRRHNDIVAVPLLATGFTGALYATAHWLDVPLVSDVVDEFTRGCVGGAGIYVITRLLGRRRVRLGKREIQIRDVTRSKWGTIVVPRQAIARIEHLTPAIPMPIVRPSAWSAPVAASAGDDEPAPSQSKPWFRDVSQDQPEPPRWAVRPILSDEQLLPSANIRIVLNDPAKVRLRHPIGLSVRWPNRSGRRKSVPQTIDIDAADVDFAYTKMLAWLNRNHDGARS
jgi:hypothetical protein